MTKLHTQQSGPIKMKKKQIPHLPLNGPGENSPKPNKWAHQLQHMVFKKFCPLSFKTSLQLVASCKTLKVELQQVEEEERERDVRGRKNRTRVISLKPFVFILISSYYKIPSLIIKIT